MFAKLTLNKEKLIKYNENIQECRDTYDDFEMDDVTSLDEVFLPYQALLDDNGWENMINLSPDRKEDFTGFYICDLNEHYTIPQLTDYNEAKENIFDIKYVDRGLSDNATQILDRIKFLASEDKEINDEFKKKEFVVLMTPIFKMHQPEKDGWRWEKWGAYIGVYDEPGGYLVHNEGIDYVYVYAIIAVTKGE